MVRGKKLRKRGVLERGGSDNTEETGFWNRRSLYVQGRSEVLERLMDLPEILRRRWTRTRLF